MTNTIGLKITCFLLIYSAIDQGYMGLSLASCNMEIWDLQAELGQESCYLDFFFSETKFSETETFSQDHIFPKPRLFSDTKFFETETETFFRDQFLL